MKRVSNAVVLWVALLAAASCGAGINAWTTTGPRGGVSLLASDPAVAGRVFASTPSGVYRSLDGGARYLPTGLDGPVQQLAVRAGSGNVVYAAVGDYYLRKSTDGGHSWTRLPGLLGWDTSLRGNTVTRLYAPARPLDLYVLDRGDLYYSADDAASWQRIGATGPYGDVAVDPVQPGTLYLAAGGSLLRTVDNGQAWVGMPGFPVAPGARVKLAFDPADPRRLHVLSIAAPEFRTASLHTSTDAGATWVLRGAFTVPDGALPVQFVLDPLDGRRMRALVDAALYGSDDGGASWQVIATSAAERVAAFAFGDVAGSAFVAGAVNGVQRTRDGGASWEPHRAGLPGDAVRALAIGGATSFAYLAAGTTAHRRVAGANRWVDVAATRPELDDIADFWMHPTTGAAYALHRDRTVWRSDDNGATWGLPGAINVGGSAPCGRIVGARRDDQMIIVVGESTYSVAGFEYRGCAALSLDGGLTWRNIDPAIRAATGNNGYGYTVAAFDPGRSATLWVAPASPFSGELYRSDDSGATWRVAARPGSAATSPIIGIHIDADDPDRMVVNTLDGHLYRSNNQGTGWIQLVPPAPVMRTLTVDWSGPVPLFYAGTADGVFLGTGTGGAGWTRVEGSDGLVVNALALARPLVGSERLTLVAATTTGVHEFTADPAGRFVPVYRFFNTATATHFYTALESERRYVLANLPSFIDEGTAFWALAAPAAGSVPVYRFYNRGNGTHFYTASAFERDYVQANLPAYVFEGEVYHAFGSVEPGTAPVYRFYNPVAAAHFYTADDDEWLYVRQHLPWFVDEGVTYTVFPAAP